MSSSYVLLPNLRPGRSSNTAEVRLLRFWEARNVRKGGEVMSVDMLLLDEQSTLIHGIINSSCVWHFPETAQWRLSMVLMSGEVTQNSDSLTLLCPYDSVRGLFLKKRIPTSGSDSVATSSFWHTNKELPDIFGELNTIRSTITDGLDGSQRVMVTLRLEGGVHVCVSLFYGHTVTFQARFDQHTTEPKVMIFTSVNPKVVGGKLFLNATSGTHFYFDCDTSIDKEHYERLVGNGANANQVKSDSCSENWAINRCWT